MRITPQPWHLVALAALTALAATAQIPGPDQSWAAPIAGNDTTRLMVRYDATLAILKEDYIEEVDEARLAQACIKAMKADSIFAASSSRRAVEQALLTIQRERSAADADEALDRCLHGVFAMLGGHSAYLDAKKQRELWAGSRPEAGIGLELAQDPEGVMVVTVLEDGPAQGAGLLRSDVVTRIDQQALKGRALDEVVQLMRGRPGSRITLTLQRAGEAAPRELAMLRAPIRLRSVNTRRLAPGLGYLKISQFQERTIDDLGAEMSRLVEQEGPLRGLVLDLRGNQGGLLDSSLLVAMAFLPPGRIVVQLKGRTPQSQFAYTNTPQVQRLLDRSNSYRPPLERMPREMQTVPLMVLVDSRTAAGAEILAAAMQDHQRARLIGQTTFGKGTIETLRPLPDRQGALKITTARIWRPNGQPLDGKGVVPDIPMPGPSTEERALQGTQALPLPELLADPVVQRAMQLLPSADR